MDFVQINIGEKQKRDCNGGFLLYKSKATDYCRHPVTGWLQGGFYFVQRGDLFGRCVCEV
jgi:hypothetical protein